MQELIAERSGIKLKIEVYSTDKVLNGTNFISTSDVL